MAEMPEKLQSEGFNPRLRAGGDAWRAARNAAGKSFNPRLRAGGDAVGRADSAVDDRFQSTPPRGRRPIPASTSR